MDQAGDRRGEIPAGAPPTCAIVDFIEMDAYHTLNTSAPAPHRRTPHRRTPHRRTFSLPPTLPPSPYPLPPTKMRGCLRPATLIQSVYQ